MSGAASEPGLKENVYSYGSFPSFISLLVHTLTKLITKTVSLWLLYIQGDECIHERLLFSVLFS